MDKRIFDKTFENYNVDSSNRFAFKASQAIVDYPGNLYNPLFIWGPTGVGKTHLLCAIKNSILLKKPDSVVLMINVEELSNFIPGNIHNNDLEDFKNKLRNCDFLLIDDLQLLEGKPELENELAEAVLYLEFKDKQVVLTCTKNPDEIPLARKVLCSGKALVANIPSTIF